MSRYYPLSQIKSNLYTKGNEYVISSTGIPYKGYYHTTSNNESFSGKTPTDYPVSLLNPVEIQIENNEVEFEEDIVNNKQSYWTIGNPNYQYGQNIEPKSPISTYVKPKQSDYELGEFERYFLSKTNEIKFLEVNKFTYNQYFNQNSNVAYQLYQPIKLSWELTGIEDEVYEVNYRTVERIQENLQLRGFVEYFRGRFDKFYKIVG
jgi:hypothetical protein